MRILYNIQIRYKYWIFLKAHFKISPINPISRNTSCKIYITIPRTAISAVKRSSKLWNHGTALKTDKWILYITLRKLTNGIKVLSNIANIFSIFWQVLSPLYGPWLNKFCWNFHIIANFCWKSCLAKSGHHTAFTNWRKYFA